MEKGIQRFSKSRCDFETFIECGKLDLNALIEKANPLEALKLKVSPEFHFARLLKTAHVASSAQFSEDCFDKWYLKYETELTALKPPKDKGTRYMDFLAACESVNTGYGECTLSRALQEAKNSKPPPIVERIGNAKLSLLACICSCLAKGNHPGLFYLSSRTAAELLEMDAMSAHRMLNALCGLSILKIVKKGIPGANGKATRYSYVGVEPPQEDDLDLEIDEESTK